MTERPNIDSAIDAVARRLTTGDPPPHLRARVLARLDERRSMRWAWALGAAAVAAIVLLSAVATRQQRPGPAIAKAPVSSREMPSPTEQMQTRASGAAIARPAVFPLRSRITMSAPTSDELAWRARAVPALEQPKALTLDAIQPEPLEIRPLVTTPLSVVAIGDDEDKQ